MTARHVHRRGVPPRRARLHPRRAPRRVVRGPPSRRRSPPRAAATTTITATTTSSTTTSTTTTRRDRSSSFEPPRTRSSRGVMSRASANDRRRDGLVQDRVHDVLRDGARGDADARGDARGDRGRRRRRRDRVHAHGPGAEKVWRRRRRADERPHPRPGRSRRGSSSGALCEGWTTVHRGGADTGGDVLLRRVRRTASQRERRTWRSSRARRSLLQAVRVRRVPVLSQSTRGGHLARPGRRVLPDAAGRPDVQKSS